MTNGQDRVGVRTTLVVTNLTKLAGVAVAVKAVFFAPSIKPVAVLLVMLLILGAQGVEELVLGFMRQFFGVDPQKNKDKVEGDK